jgi:hypothetical protein
MKTDFHFLLFLSVLFKLHYVSICNSSRKYPSHRKSLNLSEIHGQKWFLAEFKFRNEGSKVQQLHTTAITAMFIFRFSLLPLTALRHYRGLCVMTMTSDSTWNCVTIVTQRRQIGLRETGWKWEKTWRSGRPHQKAEDPDVKKRRNERRSKRCDQITIIIRCN